MYPYQKNWPETGAPSLAASKPNRSMLYALVALLVCIFLWVRIEDGTVPRHSPGMRTIIKTTPSVPASEVVSDIAVAVVAAGQSAEALAHPSKTAHGVSAVEVHETHVPGTAAAHHETPEHAAHASHAKAG